MDSNGQIRLYQLITLPMFPKSAIIYASLRCAAYQSSEALKRRLFSHELCAADVCRSITLKQPVERDKRSDDRAEARNTKSRKKQKNS